MSFNPSLKGLNTEVTPQSAGEDSLLDVADMVISQTDKLESRHGIDVQTIANLSSYNATNANVSVFKIPFSSAFATSSGFATKYVLLSGGNSAQQELVTPNTFAALSLSATSTLPTVYTQKPLGFTFDQSFYIVGANGWQEMKTDVLDSGATGVKKIIQWPPFTDINIETFQDTLDFSANWLDINKKVGIRLTYVWNTRYNDETPREVESEPSQIFEVLHPMALRTQVANSEVSTTVKDKSRIRLRIGSNFSAGTTYFDNYVTSASNGRKFFIRIYRTRQVDISEALPTEYFTAFPDIEIGGSTRYEFDTSANPGLVNTTTDYVDFGSAEAANWKNGSYFRYATNGTEISPLVANTSYYLGNKSGTSYQIFSSNLLTNPINLTSVGAADQFFIRVYEANLTVNDDGIQTLPQLYTNPNLDGEPNRNSIPPIAESVVEYKNYHVAANIREPLRAYVTLVSQPFVKTIKTSTSITINTASKYGLTVNCLSGYNLDGITSGNFKIESPYWFESTPTITVNSNTQFSTGANNSNTNFSSETGTYPLTQTVSDLCLLFQSNATMHFQFTGGASAVSASILPKYNRPDLYARTGDTNLEFLQYTGLKSDGYGNINTPYLVGETRGLVPVVGKIFDTGTIAFNGSSDVAVTLSGANVLDIGKLSEPGIIGIQEQVTGVLLPTLPAIFSYKTIVKSGTNVYTFTGAKRLLSGGASFPGPVVGSDSIIFFIDSSTLASSPVYLLKAPLPLFSSATTSSDPFPARTSTSSVGVGFLPANGYYAEPIAVYNTTDVNASFKDTLMLGNLARSPAQLLDLAVIEFVQRLNAANPNADVKFIKTENVGEFYVEYYGGTKIEARIEGDYHSYEPEIVRSASTYTTIAEYKQNNIRAVSVSRYNAPETFPDSQVLAPILVGSDKAKIVALAKNSNDCFILKEDGIWRLTISGNTSLPFIEEVQQIDTTTYCQAPYSVQEINEEVIFLSQKGFISISGNSINSLGRNIETEVKSKLQRSIQKGLAGQIRSWVNEEKRIYGCTIPDSTVTFTTYVFNTYTREWTKFSLPIIDATTDSQGRTTYVVGQYAVTMDVSGTLQEQINNSSSGALVNYTLTEEIHTDGQNRNELDQWDYWYKPASAVDNGNGTATLTDQSSLAPWSRLGGSTTDITQSGLAFFVDKQAYYIKSGVLYPATFVSRTATTVTVAFAAGVPASIATVGASDGLYAGVGASVTFNPSSVGTPDTNKQFSEYMVHVDEAVSSLNMKFKTDSQASFSATREFAFVTNAPNRTIYRTYIPISACRGRWFIRQVNHSVPYERLVITGQTLNIRDTGSSRVQKHQ